MNKTWSWLYNGVDFWSDDDAIANATHEVVVDFDSILKPQQDVSVDAVLTSLYFNSIVFVMLMIIYEFLRRLFPRVYSSRKRLSAFVRANGMVRERNIIEDKHNDSESQSPTETDPTAEKRNVHFSSSHSSTSEADNLSTTSPLPPLADFLFRQQNLTTSTNNLEVQLPDNQPLDWIQPVFGVRWTLIRRHAGLDGYFFLRYIRMCVRITAVSTFWFFLTLVPIYATGESKTYSAEGWYHLSAANVPADSWRMWMPVLFAYLFFAFTIFVIKQEFTHFLELRQDFLARGSAHVLPQNRYSLIVENIPHELRSDKALFDYFNELFPGKVHSANVALKVPELEETSRRCMRTCRRLEKSLAFLQATGKRPSHRSGQGRISIMGLDLEPVNTDPVFLCTEPEPMMINIQSREESIRSSIHKPPRFTKVDSISYYTMELAEYSRNLAKLQKDVAELAESGSPDKGASGWVDVALGGAESIANQVMEDSILENSLLAPSDSYGSVKSYAENMSSKYGSIGLIVGSDKRSRLLEEDAVVRTTRIASPPADIQVPFSANVYSGTVRKWAGRMGLDFVVAGLRLVSKQFDLAVENVLGSTMSSTGFVTFLDLTSVTCAASSPLTVKFEALQCSVAPEPREINWQNVTAPKPTLVTRERFANIILFVGVILWSFPLTAIQVFAKAEYLAQLPGMEWIVYFHGGTFAQFVNGYLPVVALLFLIVLLPLIFEQIAVRYERRKTFSDVQTSILRRYFYYQLANVYVSVTAGSLLKSLADILERPSNILSLLGESLPTMVGYFVALLVTKIMAGLPMIFLRFGALSRMLLLRLLARSEKKVTQRELDWVYRLENVQYGWEFPTQLLVVVIVFTYAVICPVILPVGLTYFLGALVVYKKQILYVYSPVYESGGAMFPVAVQRTLFGLVCSQMTLLGYIVTRGCYYQPAALIPLPFLTIWAMGFFSESYGAPSTRLSLERARHYDTSLNVHESKGNLDASFDRTKDRSLVNIEERRKTFDRNAYRQPVLTEIAALPWMYRRGVNDEDTVKVRDQLRRIAVADHLYEAEHNASVDAAYQYTLAEGCGSSSLPTVPG